MLLRDKLRANLLLKQYILEVDLHHIGLFNEELAFAMQDRPADVLPLVCKKKNCITCPIHCHLLVRKRCHSSSPFSVVSFRWSRRRRRKLFDT